MDETFDPIDGVYPFDSRPKGDGWTCIAQDIYSKTWIRPREDGRGFDQCVMERVGPVLDANERLRNDSDGKRFGDGQIVASIPLAKYYRDILPMKQAGDTTGIKRYLNDPDNRKLRTFRGNI